MSPGSNTGRAALTLFSAWYGAKPRQPGGFFLQKTAPETPHILRRTALRFAVVALACVCLSAGAQTGVQSLLGKKAPEFARPTLSGQPLDLGRLSGKVVLLNFWASWCAPCLTEMPAFAQWQRQYGPQGFAVVGISMDDDAAQARKMVARLKLDYPVAMGNARLGERYGGVLGLPMTFLIDRQGIVRAEFQGESNLAKMETELKGLLRR